MDLTSRAALGTQYGTDANLAARGSIYRFRRPGSRPIFDVVLDLAELAGDEVVVDVGCGNGSYLATLAERGHRGPVLGLDLSLGMLAAARGRGTGAPLTAGDAQALPWRAAAADVALCPHMLYHVPDQAAAVAELRRVVRPGGRALVTGNSVRHFGELDRLAAEIAGTEPIYERVPFTMDSGEAVLRTAFASVERHQFGTVLDVTEPEATVDYVASARELYGIDDDGLAELRRRVTEVVERHGAFAITTAPGVFVCS